MIKENNDISCIKRAYFGTTGKTFFWRFYMEYLDRTKLRSRHKNLRIFDVLTVLKFPFTTSETKRNY